MTPQTTTISNLTVIYDTGAISSEGLHDANAHLSAGLQYLINAAAAASEESSTHPSALASLLCHAASIRAALYGKHVVVASEPAQVLIKLSEEVLKGDPSVL